MQYHAEAESQARGEGSDEQRRPSGTAELPPNTEYQRHVSRREFDSRLITRPISQSVDSNSAVSKAGTTRFLSVMKPSYLVAGKHGSISPWILRAKCGKSLSISAQKCLALELTDRAASRPPPDGRRQLQNSGLMVQIGLLLGLAYLGFLALWFWATRFRTKPKPSRSTHILRR